jgi:hypothetical protein
VRQIAASKKKGMWMGGVPPLGYRAQDGKLIIVESEAETLRFIFRRYAELGSVRLLKDELDACGIHGKLRVSASGRRRGGKPFGTITRSALGGVIDGIRPRKSGSHQTHRWREMDSNLRFPNRSAPVFETAVPSPMTV